MREVCIDLSSDNHLQQPQIFGGYAGEHNETVLKVKLPERMIDIECSHYRFDFQTSEDNKISSPPIPVDELKNGVLSFHLTEQLSIAGKLLFNVVAILSSESSVSLISKTNMVTLYIGGSPHGNSVPLNPNGYKDEMLSAIDARISEVVNNTFASAIRNTVSGDVIKVSDVSPIAHELEVKVKSRNKIENYVDFSTITSVNAVFGEYCTLEVVDDVIIVTPKSDNLVCINLPALNVLCPNIPSDTKATFYFEVETEETAIKNNAYIATPPKDVYQGIETLIEYPWSDYSTPDIGYAQTYLCFETPVTKPLKIKNLKIGIPTDEPAIEDLTTVSVTAQGKNILPFPYIETSGKVSSGVTFTVNEDGSVSAKGTSKEHAVFRLGNANNVHLKDGVSYVVSCGYANRYIYVTYLDEDAPTKPKYWGNLNYANPLVWSDKYTLLSVNIQFYPNSTVDMTLYPQIEVGEVATEYEPYVEPFTVSANADGTVKGLMSISPSMKLMTDTADVTIDLAYNADTKMYIDNKFNELATALLNA